MIGKTPYLCPSSPYVEKNEKIYSSCEIDQERISIKAECFPSYMCDTSIARVTGCVYPREAHSLVTPLLMPWSTGLRRSALFRTRKLYHPHSGGQSQISVELRMHKTIILGVTM